MNDAMCGQESAQRQVLAMFARIARRYDRANFVLTLGRDRSWRRSAARAADLRAGETVLDLACGTGSLTTRLYQSQPALQRLVALDAVPEMLDIARERFPYLPIRWQVGDAMAMPFDDESFDAVAVAFGLRNLPDTPAALAEIRRVLKPGGRLVVLEFARPERDALARLNAWLSRRWVPLVGSLVTGDRTGAYRYLVNSIDGYLRLDEMAQAIEAAGVRVLKSRRFALSPVGLHVGVRP